MRRIITIIALLFYVSVFANEWFPFGDVNHKWNVSINGGYSPTGRVALYGIGCTIRGFHLTIGGLGSTHEHDINVDTWNEDASFMMQAGYQIPVIKSFRLIPVIGITGIGEAQTDGWDWSIQNDRVNNKVTMNLKYKFDYGIHAVFNHRKLIINFGVTRYTLLGGIGVEF